MKGYKIQKIFVIIMILVIVIGAAIGISYNYKKNKQYELIFIPKVIDESNDFWKSLIAGVKMGADEYGAKLTVVAGESEEDYQRQNELIEWAIKEKPDALLVSPSSYTKSTELLKEASQKGIKLVLIDSVVDEKVEDIIVATDNFDAGVKLGEYASWLIDKDAQIGIVGHVKGTSTAMDREAGVRIGLRDKESCIKEVVFCGSGYDKAYELTMELTKKYKDLDMIFGLNEYSAVGAARAINEAGLGGKVKVMGFDSSIEEIQLMEAGVFQGIVIQKPFNMGYLGVEQAIKLLTGEETARNLYSGSKLINLRNLYSDENQKLLFPFANE